MDNQFYDDFDTACFGAGRKADYRTPFQKDRDRIIHTFAFRRLQNKTQVFLSGEYDFYRTRLTHSIEVAQIGRSICNYLKQEDPALGDRRFISPALVEAACIAHDLGHPPFGHAGEDTLNELMETCGGFEANAQTLRLLTDTIYEDRDRDGRTGMSPTRALIDGVLRYKTTFSEHPDGKEHFVYDNQEPVLDFVFDGRAVPPARYAPGAEKNALRSIECQIMDWADDAAYSTNDLIDGIRAGFISVDAIREWERGGETLDDPETEWVDELTDAIRDGRAEPHLSAQIGKFVQACSLKERSGFMSGATNRYAYVLAVEDRARRRAELYSSISADLLFQSPRVIQLEHKGENMLRRLFDSLQDNYLGDEAQERPLLPRDVHDRITKIDRAQVDDADAASLKPRKARRLCDYVAGMTDGFASRTYKRLFDPDFGSIVDLV